MVLLVGDAKDLLFEVFGSLEVPGWLDSLALVLEGLGCVEVARSVDKASEKLLDILFALDVVLLVGDAKDLLFEVFGSLGVPGWLDSLTLELEGLGCVEVARSVDKASEKLLDILFALDVVLLVGDAKDLLFEVFGSLGVPGWLDSLTLVLGECGCAEIVPFGEISVVFEVLLSPVVVLLAGGPVRILLEVLI